MFSKRSATLFCLLAAFSNAFGASFELGEEKTFSIINDVTMYELKTADQSIGYRISGSVKVVAIYGNDEVGFLLRFELESPQLYQQKFKVNPIDYDEKKSSSLKELHKTQFFALWRDGLIEKVFLPPTKDSSVYNFMRSIQSLFQYKLRDSESSQEDDISGTCDVKYSAKSSTKFMKFKTNCLSDLEFHERTDKPLGTSNRFTRVNVITTSADGQLESIHSTDHHKFSVNAYPNVGFMIGSLFYLKFDGHLTQVKASKALSLDEVLKEQGELLETTLLPASNEEESTETTKLIKLIKENKDNLSTDKVGQSVSAQTLLNLLPAGKLTKSEEFIRILNARSTKEIRGQLMDLLGAIQTTESHAAFKKCLNFTNELDFDDIERYLQSLAVGVRPEETVIQDLLTTLIEEDLQNEKLKDSLIQAVSSMAKHYANSPWRDFDSPTVVEVKNFLMKSINVCDDDDCKVKFVRGLQNLRSPDTVEKLMNLALNYPYKISVAAMKALKTFSADFFTKEMKEKLENIFYQRTKKFDSSARTIALDILLELKPETNEVVEFVRYLGSSDRSYEVKQYLIQKLKMISEKCPQFNQMLMMCLERHPKVNNWNVYGALKGLSTALVRRFSQQPSFNGSLLSIQEMKGGSLKRGNVDLLMRSGDEEMSLFSLGIFAGGLSSFISSSEEEEVDPNEDTTATAGMELAIQGVLLRPLVFFSGQGELMGHVWSGSASEPTSAYKGTSLLQDHKQIISLNNGALMDFSTLGAISIDLNGKIEISLWYKNANSEVVQNIGTNLVTSVFLKSSFVQMGIESNLSEEPQIVLSSKIDFSSKTSICMQLSQPNTKLTQAISKSISIPGDKKKFSRLTYLRYNLPGYTHVLNRKNTEMCNEILK